MEELPPPSRQVRKSAHGRTQLFLPSTSTILKEIHCMGSVTKYDRASVFHVLPKALDDPNACCWHCCESVSRGLSIPRLYDSVERVFHVYGKVCSPECGKAYILEHSTFDRGQHLNALTKMLREVYDIDEPIRETPPRPALRRFGGVFQPRGRDVECRIVEPPFVSYSMIAEERLPDDRQMTGPKFEMPRQSLVDNDDEMFDEPQGPSMFSDFVETHTDKVDVPPREDSKRKRPVSGPLSRFVKSK